MSINQANITAQVSRFSTLIEQWKSKQPQGKGFTRPLSEVGPGVDRSGKDVIVALRTRPPIPSEHERFILTTPEESDQAGADDPAFDFCIGVDVRGAEPGKMVAHVPAMKVSSSTSSYIAEGPLNVLTTVTLQWNGPTLT